MIYKAILENIDNFSKEDLLRALEINETLGLMSLHLIMEGVSELHVDNYKLSLVEDEGIPKQELEDKIMKMLKDSISDRFK